MNQPSLRKTRAAVGDMIGIVNGHSKMFDGLAPLLKDFEARLRSSREQLDSLLERGFLGRLKWLFTGH